MRQGQTWNLIFGHALSQTRGDALQLEHTAGPNSLAALFHVAGSFVYGLSTFLASGEVVLPTLLGMRNKFFVERYWTFVERHNITLLAAVPTVMSSLLSVSFGDANLTRVRALFTGGAPLPDEIATNFERRFGIQVRNILGMTECAGVIFIGSVALAVCAERFD